jgi:hypothetical protein
MLAAFMTGVAPLAIICYRSTHHLTLYMANPMHTMLVFLVQLTPPLLLFLMVVMGIAWWHTHPRIVPNPAPRRSATYRSLLLGFTLAWVVVTSMHMLQFLYYQRPALHPIDAFLRSTFHNPRLPE